MPDRRLEHYLATVATQLRSLPVAARDEEMRELHQHLESLVADNRARGLGEAEAIDAALLQFGVPERVGRQLAESTVSYQRPSLWRTLAIYLLLVAVIFALFAIANDKPTDFPHDIGDQLLLALTLPAGLLALRMHRYRKSQTRRA